MSLGYFNLLGSDVNALASKQLTEAARAAGLATASISEDSFERLDGQMIDDYQ